MGELMGEATPGALEVRRADHSDDAAVLALLRETMGWDAGGHDEDFFWWKHRANPFGESPAWLALHEGEVVGYRTFLRWTFLDEADKELRCLRAVDTVTHPDHRGRGIFRLLTLEAVADLTREGDAWIFNTPNDQSRPGYLKMGWTVNRRLPVGAMPRRFGSAGVMLRSREPAELWSQETTAGLDAAAALADDEVAAALLLHAPSTGVRTRRSPEYLRWRTAYGPLRYRLVLASDSDPSRGGLVFRVRRRGRALEAAIIEELVPDSLTGARLVRQVLAETGADYAIGLARRRRVGLVPLPGQGPILTTRPLSRTPPAPGDWALTLGDVELF